MHESPVSLRAWFYSFTHQCEPIQKLSRSGIFDYIRNKLMKNTIGYKIIASDLDGTLLNSNAQVSRENLLAISELSKNGVHFVPSTGRTFSEIPPELRDNPDIRYVIYSNGAVVFDKMSEKRIINGISGNDRQFVLDELAFFDCHLTVRHNGECFVDSEFQTKAWWDYYNLCEAHRVVVRDYAAYLPNFKECCRSMNNIEVFSVFFHNNDDKIAFSNLLKAHKSLRSVEGAEHNLEIMSASAGKGNALRDLAQMLGIDIADTISIGDSDNDCSIIQAAGCGLAVSNAVDSLKSVADDIVCSNDEHVADYILSRFFKRNIAP